MKGVVALVLLLSVFAQEPKKDLPKGQMPDLGRPTTKENPLPVFDFEEYFTGTWHFEWIVPESPLGPGGVITGTEVFKPGLDGRFFDSEIAATGPNGPFTAKSKTIYNPDNKFMARHETDSRGFSMMKAGHIGGDLGGYYTIYYETAPFEHNGKTLQMRMTMILFSPLNFKVRAKLSVDGGPFVNFGNPWWRKDVPGLESSQK